MARAHSTSYCSPRRRAPSSRDSAARSSSNAFSNASIASVDPVFETRCSSRSQMPARTRPSTNDGQGTTRISAARGSVGRRRRSVRRRSDAERAIGIMRMKGFESPLASVLVRRSTTSARLMVGRAREKVSALSMCRNTASRLRLKCPSNVAPFFDHCGRLGWPRLSDVPQRRY